MSTTTSTNFLSFSFLSKLTILLIITLKTRSECHVKITYSGACILVSSCDNETKIKYLEPLAMALVSQEDCTYENLKFSFKDQPCTIKLEKLDKKEIETSQDELANNFMSLESQDAEDKQKADEMGDTNRAVLSDCGLEEDLDSFNSMQYDQQNSQVIFVDNPDRLFII
jgi:hypothetical protein